MKRAHRRRQQFLKWKNRIENRLPFWYNFHDMELRDGTKIKNPTWKDAMQSDDFNHLRSTSGGCGCWMCKNEKYNRTDYKKRTQEILKEE